MREHSTLMSLVMAGMIGSGLSGTAGLVPVGPGWAGSSVNAVVFRRNSVVSHGQDQVVAYYDEDGVVTLARRRLESTAWEIRKSQYRGNVRDAHNAISIMIDGAGFLHMAWDHHGHPLRYCRSTAPGSLELTDKLPMTGHKEGRVTYPEFYRLPDGDLLCLYRDGSSGRGDLMLNHYDVKARRWTQRQDAFVHGEGERNAYWQMCTDTGGAIHLSWVWRESGDIATNHDLGYARSLDGGRTWQRSDGSPYKLPITAATTEYAARIPQGSDLINTTSMCADSRGRPYIATYWRSEGSEVPQYHLVHHDGSRWRTLPISRRHTPFSLQGGGTKRIPISRCQILADGRGPTDRAYLLFRDVERDHRVSVAICDDLDRPTWRVRDLTDFPVGRWEPSYDTELWKREYALHVFVQNVDQGDADRPTGFPPQPVSVLEWTPDPAPPVEVPPMTEEHPGPGRRVRVVPPESAGAGVYHSLYLPENHRPDGSYPILVEYTGNRYPRAGSTGEVRDAGLGYPVAKALGAIWVVFPYLSEDRSRSVVQWWGSPEETLAYCTRNLRRICQTYGGNPAEVILCGFSRGAIGVNYLGLHDDAAADIWLGFFSHDHYDGVRAWNGTAWGSPEAAYRREARERLRRMAGRAALISQADSTQPIRDYLAENGLDTLGQFTFLDPPIDSIIPGIPTPKVPHRHTDRWLGYPSRETEKARQWFRHVLLTKPGTVSVSDRVLHADDTPAPGIVVDGGSTHFAQTDAEGQYRIDGLIPGPRQIAISPDNLLEGLPPPQFLTPAGNVNGIDLRLP